ncbi:HemK2/MTQ2 family protein methyltransferase [Rhodococcoides fascians]|uniref:HemK2/MTQ2 family protein methyltransferase n=1 Tax=Rhodococcoides fascians TaxID=1828 RepID=UPI00050BEBC1|nr:HemK2/MTQ2 family protein methyltransferase [Rhodococcus fascians]
MKSTASDPLLLGQGTVYEPQHDSHMLAEAVLARGIPNNSRVLDLCTGSGIQALTAATLGAHRVLAVDISPAAVESTRAAARRLGLDIEARQGDLSVALTHGPFDVVLCNPPYVPSAHLPPTEGPSVAWDAGVDGRAFLDPLCRAAPDLLSDNGFLLLVHSEHSDVPKSLAMMEEGGLTASIVARQTIGFGPVLLARAAWLEANGLIAPGCRIEELAVILAQRNIGT